MFNGDLPWNKAYNQFEQIQVEDISRSHFFSVALKREAHNHLALAPNIYQPHISFFVFLPKLNHIRDAHGLSLRNFLTSHEITKLKLS